MGKEVIWSKLSLTHLEQIHTYVLEDSKSLEIADKLINDLFDSSEILKNHPELYPIDKLRKNNNGTYRAYEIYTYRISYRIFKNNIRILRVRHTSREPLPH